MMNEFEDWPGIPTAAPKQSIIFPKKPPTYCSLPSGSAQISGLGHPAIIAAARAHETSWLAK